MSRIREALPYVARRRWTVEEARAVLAAQGATGLSPRAFARREGIDVRRLERWRRQIEASQPAVLPPPPFVEMRPRATSIVEVVLECGRVVRVPESIEAEALARIVDALDRPRPC